MSPRDESELIAEEELLGLFEPRRPRAADFRAGVQERIDALEEAAAEPQEAPVESTWWRRVGGVLPIDPFGGALAGSALGKAFGGKLLPGVLALPVLLVAAAFGGFVMGARSLRRSTAGAQPVTRGSRGHPWKHGTAANRAMGAGGAAFNLIQFGSLVALGSTWLFGGSFAIDVLMSVLVLSMIALVATVANMRAAGLLTCGRRSARARRCRRRRTSRAAAPTAARRCARTARTCRVPCRPRTSRRRSHWYRCVRHRRWPGSSRRRPARAATA